jgi:hypothetical protein
MPNVSTFSQRPGAPLKHLVKRSLMYASKRPGAVVVTASVLTYAALRLRKKK